MGITQKEAELNNHKPKFCVTTLVRRMSAKIKSLFSEQVTDQYRALIRMQHPQVIRLSTISESLISNKGKH